MKRLIIGIFCILALGGWGCSDKASVVPLATVAPVAPSAVSCSTNAWNGDGSCMTPAQYVEAMNRFEAMKIPVKVKSTVAPAAKPAKVFHAHATAAKPKATSAAERAAYAKAAKNAKLAQCLRDVADAAVDLNFTHPGVTLEFPAVRFWCRSVR